ncbi:MAG: 1-acyl-sn-glycerol-3-phosphate acyltransferase [Deltaproteobacteria bacterium]|nr:1-acyl-sn-glycerol-3-phosphate acyltransferase [Deltaproteobacteria bacterium]
MGRNEIARASSSARALSRAGILGRITAPLFERVRIDPEPVERLRRAHAEGVVVHVIRSSRWIDPVFILWLSDALALPAPRWMHDHFASEVDASGAALLESVGAGEPALLFLKRPKTLIQPNESYAEPLVESLITFQRRSDRPVLLFPESLLYHRRASGLRRTVLDAIFGNREAPGRLRELLGFMVGFTEARFHLGAPLNLKELLEREGDAPARVVAKKVRWTLLSHLAREEALRTGTMERPVAKTRALVLKDRDVQVALSSAGSDARARAETILKRMVSDMRHGWVRVLDVVLDRAFSRIFDGIHVDEPGFEAVWAAARRGPVVLVPSHKSHADYLVLSQVFFRRGLSPPFIVAGDNLAIWPIGPMFRRAGAFFIRRKFSGDKLYTAICSAYVKRILRDGAALEFFIEGGRSRTGKLLAPKLGILGMTVDPVLDGSVHDVTFVPVSIGYEQIIEAGAYQHELGGGEKKKEDLGAILSTPKVLRSRYGRVYVDFDVPLSLAAFFAARGSELGAARSGDPVARRALVAELAQRIVRGIDRVTRLTPTGIIATALLGDLGRGVGERELLARADFLIDLAAAAGARSSNALANDRAAALKEALGRLAQLGLVLMLPSPDGDTILRVDERGRRGLDYYKNNVLHFFAPTAKLCLALLETDPNAVDRATAEAHVARLDALLALELPSSMGGDRDAENRRVRELALDARLAVEVDGSLTLSTLKRPLANLLARLLLPFLESLLFIAEALRDPSAETLSEKRFLELSLSQAKKQVMIGRIHCAEAATRPTLENALATIVRRGAASRKGATLSRDLDKLAALTDEIARHVRTIA